MEDTINHKDDKKNIERWKEKMKRQHQAFRSL